MLRELSTKEMEMVSGGFAGLAAFPIGPILPPLISVIVPPLIDALTPSAPPPPVQTGPSAEIDSGNGNDTNIPITIICNANSPAGCGQVTINFGVGGLTDGDTGGIGRGGPPVAGGSGGGSRIKDDKPNYGGTVTIQD